MRTARIPSRYAYKNIAFFRGSIISVHFWSCVERTFIFSLKVFYPLSVFAAEFGTSSSSSRRTLENEIPALPLGRYSLRNTLRTPTQRIKEHHKPSTRIRTLRRRHGRVLNEYAFVHFRLVIRGGERVAWRGGNEEESIVRTCFVYTCTGPTDDIHIILLCTAAEGYRRTRYTHV